MLLYLNFLVVLTRSRLRSSRQTAKFIRITANRIWAAKRGDEGIELVKISLHLENMSALCAQVITFILQNLMNTKKEEIKNEDGSCIHVTLSFVLNLDMSEMSFESGRNRDNLFNIIEFIYAFFY